MNCRELLGALSEYEDGQTHSALCQAICAHLEHCENCRLVIDNIRQTITLYRAGAEESLPPALHQRLLGVMRRRWMAR